MSHELLEKFNDIEYGVVVRACTLAGTTLEDVMSGRRFKEAVFVRSLSSNIFVREFGYTMVKVRRMFNLDYTSVSSYINNHEEHMENEIYRSSYQDIKILISRQNIKTHTDIDSQMMALKKRLSVIENEVSHLKFLITN